MLAERSDRQDGSERVCNQMTKPVIVFVFRTRGGAVWQLVGLITRRSQVQILPPQPPRPVESNCGQLRADARYALCLSRIDSQQRKFFRRAGMPPDRSWRHRIRSLTETVVPSQGHLNDKAPTA